MREGGGKRVTAKADKLCHEMSHVQCATKVQSDTLEFAPYALPRQEL